MWTTFLHYENLQQDGQKLETHRVFVDLEKAYETVPRFRRHIKYMQAIKYQYDNQISTIHVSNQISDAFEITKGLRQGCVTKFKIYIEAVLKELLARCKTMGLHIEDELLCSLLFADNLVVVTADSDDINYMLSKLAASHKEWSLKISTQY